LKITPLLLRDKRSPSWNVSDRKSSSSSVQVALWNCINSRRGKRNRNRRELSKV